MSEQTRGPGRPREQEVDQRILEAMLRLMALHGYVRTSVDMVAAEAGVTKPTIYRRYPSKEQLAVAALAEYRQRHLPTETGETRTDLVAQMRHFQTGIERRYGMAMVGTVLAEEHDTPDLLTSFREHIVRPRRAALRAILQRAEHRGELGTGAPLDLAVNMLVGAYYAQYLAGEPFRPDWAEVVVDAVLHSLRTP